MSNDFHMHTLNYRSEWERESDGADELLRLLGCDPERSRDKRGRLRLDLIKDSVRTRNKSTAIRAPLDLANLRAKIGSIAYVQEAVRPMLIDDVMDCIAAISKVPAQSEWYKIEKFVKDYVNSYEMIGESEEGVDLFHSPDENDRAWLCDCIFGLLGDPEFLVMLSA